MYRSGLSSHRRHTTPLDRSGGCPTPYGRGSYGSRVPALLFDIEGHHPHLALSQAAGLKEPAPAVVHPRPWLWTPRSATGSRPISTRCKSRKGRWCVIDVMAGTSGLTHHGTPAPTIAEGDRQRPRFASMPKKHLASMREDTAVCQTKPLISFLRGTSAGVANKISTFSRVRLSPKVSRGTS
jgi:hypothetical protein